MNNDLTNSNEHVKALTETVQELQAQSKTNAASTYEPAAVSFSFTAGPDGAQMQGWLTYFGNDKTIYCSGEGRQVYGLPIAMGVAIPVFYVFPAKELLSAKRITWEASGNNGSGILILKADGRIISRFAFPCAGWGIGNWRAEGVCRFEEK